MAIPISKYIQIKENVIQATGTINLTGLLISSDEMVNGASMKTAYDNGEVIELATSNVADMFADTTTTYKMLNAYRASTIKLIKVKADDTNLNAYKSALNQDGGFGAFACTDLGDELGDIAVYNEGLGAQHLFVAGTTNSEATNRYLLKVYNQDLEGAAAPEQVGAVLGWAASINHTARNGASTLMYKDLGVKATIDNVGVAGEDGTFVVGTASWLDQRNINYCGLVQRHGDTRKFFQNGLCADGVSAGVVMSSIYMTAVIENGWIDLAMGANKISANAAGAAKVLSLVVDAAENAIINGAILADKPLTSTQIATILEYTGDDGAPDTVQTSGYYPDARIVVVGGEYICEYTLVYAKGDHIAKVSGSHVLV